MKTIMWESESNSLDSNRSVPYAIKLLESIMCLLFKPGYTIRHKEFTVMKDEDDMTKQEKD